MDSKTLNREQLQQLVKFIRSRGFREEVVVLEILDHFACKVEELIEKHPSMPFEEAMKKAHASFGVMGFQPIAASFHEQTKKKYSRIYWTYFKEILSKPISFLLLPLAAVLYYKAGMWAEVNKYWYILDINVMFLSAIGLFIILDLLLLKGLSKKDRKHPFVSYALMSGRVMWVSGFLVAQLDHIHDPEFTWIPLSFYTCFVLYIILRFMATKQTIKKAKEDIAAIEQMTIA